MKDPYKILGVSKSASQDEIKKAYRNLVKKNHPDLNPGNKQAEMRFKEISVAYDQIGTPEARSKFDRGETDEQKQEAYSEQQKYWEEALKQGRTGSRGEAGRGPSFYNTQQNAGRYSQSFGDEFGGEDLFEELFRGARTRSAPEKGRDTLFQMEISLKDSVLGTEKGISLPNGKNISVKIPAGINSGTKLRFKGLGEPGPRGAANGDAFIEVIVAPMKGFKKVGNDIEVEVAVSFIEAILGADISVPTLYGPIMMKIPPGVNSGSRLRIKGKGVHSGNDVGNQIVKILITMPDKITPELQAAVKNWNGKFDYNPRSIKESHQTKRNTQDESHHNV